MIGSAKKNNPKALGKAITVDSFIDIFILLSMLFFLFNIKLSAMIGINEVPIAIDIVNGIFTKTDALPVSCP